MSVRVKENLGLNLYCHALVLHKQPIVALKFQYNQQIFVKCHFCEGADLDNPGPDLLDAL